MLRQSLRSLARTPGTSSIAAVALALGIGLTGATFSIVKGLVIDGLPFEDDHELVHVESSELARGIESRETTQHDYLDMRDRQSSFESLAAFRSGTVNLSGDAARPERFDGAFITPGFLEILGVRPALGRGFTAAEDRPGEPLVVLLSHTVWEERYEADPGILGRVVRVNGEPATVVGVLPEGFEFPVSQRVWLPLRLDPAEPRGEGWTLEVFGRLRDGVAIETARAELATIAEALAAEYPETNEGVGVLVKPYAEEFIGEEAHRILWTMLVAVFFVLLIACANVANLLLARTMARTRELAVRTALGARRRVIVRQLLMESLLLAAVGTAAGLVLAHFATDALTRYLGPSDIPFWVSFAIDPGVVAFVVGLTLLSALLSGLAPAVQAMRASLTEVLKDEGRGGSSLRMGRFSRGLVVAEVALSAALLVAAGLLVQTTLAITQFDLPFEPSEIATARVGLFESTYPEAEDRRAFWRELVERLGEDPRVSGAAVTSSLPGVWAGGRYYEVEGASYPDPDERPFARVATVSPSFFSVLDAEPVLGRSFRAGDDAGAPPVVLVNESFARREWPGENPVGRRLRFAGSLGGLEQEGAGWARVVGVVPDLLMSGTRNEEPAGFYLPWRQGDVSFASVVARPAGGGPETAAPAILDALAATDPDVPAYWVRSLREAIDVEQLDMMVLGLIFGIFGVVALALAAIGLYGVMAFSVGRRTREVGVRMALGARAGGVLRMVLGQGMGQIGLGLAIGLVLAIGLAQLLSGILVGVDPLDPGTYATAAAVLLAAGLAACLVPARRATRVDPVEALREG